MYTKKQERLPNYEPIIEVIKNGLKAAVEARNKSHITYVLLRSSMMAWIALGGGYETGSDVKAILADIHDEFSARLTASLKAARLREGDVTDPIVIPEKTPPKPDIKIYGADGKPKDMGGNK